MKTIFTPLKGLFSVCLLTLTSVSFAQLAAIQDAHGNYPDQTGNADFEFIQQIHYQGNERWFGADGGFKDGYGFDDFMNPTFYTKDGEVNHVDSLKIILWYPIFDKTWTGSTTYWSKGGRVWIDWNRNENFEESEMVWQTTDANGDPDFTNRGTMWADFDVPANLDCGKYIMRIAVEHRRMPEAAAATRQIIDGDVIDLEFTIVQDYCTPVVPSNYDQTTDDCTSTEITWGTSCSANSYEVQWRQLGDFVWNSSGTLAPDPQNQNVARINNLVSGTTYEYRLATNCDGFPTEYSSLTTFTFQGRCEAVQMSPTPVQNPTCNSAQITWIKPCVTDGYILQWKENDDYWSANIPLDENTTTYTFTNLHDGDQIDYRITNLCTGNPVTESLFVFSGNCEAAMPSLVPSANTCDAAQITWDEVCSAEGFQVKWSVNGGVLNTSSVLGATTTQFTINGLNTGDDLDYTLVTLCATQVQASGNYTFAANCGVVTPTADVATMDCESIDITWPQTCGVEEYTLEYRQVGSSSWTSIGNLDGNSTGYTLSGLSTAVSYEYRLNADCDNPAQSVQTSGVQSFTFDGGCIKVTPTHVASANTCTTAQLSWNIPCVTNGYEIEWRVDDGSWSAPVILNATTTQYTLTGLTEGDEVEVRFTNVCSTDKQTLMDFVFDSGCEAAVPSVDETTLGCGSLDLVWDEICGASGYQLQWSKNGQALPAQNLSANQTSFTIIGVSNSDLIEYTLITHCASNRSASGSYEFYGTCNVVTPTANESTQTCDGIDIDWPSSCGPTGYTLRYRAQGTTQWQTQSVFDGNSSGTHIDGLSLNTRYEYELEAHCVTNQTSSIKWFDFVGGVEQSPGIPTDLDYGTHSCLSNTVALTWTARPGNESIVSYNIVVEDTYSGQQYTTTSTTNSVTVQLNTLVNPIQFWVQSVNCLGDTSSYSPRSYSQAWPSCGPSGGGLEGPGNQPASRASTYEPSGLLEERTPTLELFPNPAGDDLSLRWSGEATRLEVRNLKGQLVMEQSVNGTAAQVSLVNLTAGQYLVTVFTDLGTQTSRLVKK
ncbi:MAG TPA: hypothetical protein DCE41_35805 [Cytophagales bacterium]|nr:hypothetical protein [Cytophagales bacterium]HAP58317.1 hypothetical protein [Cytophagales bacterium]